MAEDWVPFHRRLAKGPKRSIPRGVRFVLLELSLEARATRGVIDLPADWSTVDSVHDLIRGDRREIQHALDVFTVPDETGVSPIRIQKTPSTHRVTLTNWEAWMDLGVRKAVGSVQRARLMARDGLVCGLCGSPVDADDVHIDHIRPVALGGGSEDGNLRVTHSTCNLRRPRWPAEYMQ
jgi:5-methylcytosine-specific restriction endonuclease McrA